MGRERPIEGRPLRLLALIDSLIAAGAQRSLVAVAPIYRDLGIELHVAHLRARTVLAAELESAGTVVHHLSGPERRTAWIRSARQLIRDLDPDIIHTTLYEADLAGRAAAVFVDIPVVSSFVTDSYGPEHLDNPEYRRWKVRAAQLVDMASARRVDRFHSVSENAAELMHRRLRIARDRIDVVPRGRDSESLGLWSEERRLATRGRIGIAPETPLVVGAGRHYHVKGFDILVAAFAEVLANLPAAVLYVAGKEGPATDMLRSIAHSSGIEPNVLFAGYRDDVPDLLVAADVFVLPSRMEGSPGILLEAMALRAAAVASDIPGAAEVAGMPPVVTLVPLEDHSAMAEAIVALLGDDDLRSNQAAAAYQRFVENYTTERVVRDMMLVYARAAEARGQTALKERFEQAANVSL